MIVCFVIASFFIGNVLLMRIQDYLPAVLMFYIFSECLIKYCPNLASDILLNELGSTPILLFWNFNHRWACISVVSVACFVFYCQLKSAPTPLQLAPENTRRGSAYQTLPHQVGWMASDGVMNGMDGRSGRYHANEYYASPNDMGLLNFNHIDIPNTETLVKKVHISQKFLKLNERLLCQRLMCVINRWKGYYPIQMCIELKGQRNCL